MLHRRRNDNLVQYSILAQKPTRAYKEGTETKDSPIIQTIFISGHGGSILLPSMNVSNPFYKQLN